MSKEAGDVLTTGQAAKMMRVSARTVCVWCDSGELDHYTLPSRRSRNGDRRILRKALLAFATKIGAPTDLINPPSKETDIDA
jgi:hypothetical protein